MTRLRAVLFDIDEAGRLAIPTVAVPLKPKPGQTIIGLVDVDQTDE